MTKVYETELISDVQYGEAGGHKLFLDIVRPVQPPEEPMPVIMYIHGGGWMGGDKAKLGGRHNATFARHGFFTVSINHRLTGVAPFPAQIHDAKAAVRWLRAHAEEYNIDPNKIGVWGHSSGGHLAALLATSGDVPELEGDSGSPGYSSRVQAAVTSCGPVDVLQMGGWHDLPNSPEARLVDAERVQDNPELARLANPITYINGDEPPVLILHGDQDSIVPVMQAELLYEALQDVSLLRVKQADHDDYNGGNLQMVELLDTVRSFFTKHLCGTPQSKAEIMERREQMEQFIRNLWAKHEAEQAAGK